MKSLNIKNRKKPRKPILPAKLKISTNKKPGFSRRLTTSEKTLRKFFEKLKCVRLTLSEKWSLWLAIEKGIRNSPNTSKTGKGLSMNGKRMSQKKPRKSSARNHALNHPLKDWPKNG